MTIKRGWEVYQSNTSIIIGNNLRIALVLKDYFYVLFGTTSRDALIIYL